MFFAEWSQAIFRTQAHSPHPSQAQCLWDVIKPTFVCKVEPGKPSLSQHSPTCQIPACAGARHVLHSAVSAACIHTGAGFIRLNSCHLRVKVQDLLYLLWAKQQC